MSSATNNHVSWLVREGWVWLSDAVAVAMYAVLMAVSHQTLAATVPEGNQPPQSTAEHLAFIGAAMLGSVFGGLASMHAHRLKRFSWNTVTTIGVYSAVFGLGATPLAFWYLDWPYRVDHIFGIAFALALFAEMLKNTGTPIIQNVLPSVIESWLAARAQNGTQRPNRNHGAGDRGGDAGQHGDAGLP